MPGHNKTIDERTYANKLQGGFRESADLLKQVAKTGYVKIPPKEGLLTEREIAEGYTLQEATVPQRVETAKMFVKIFTPKDEDGGFMGKLAKLTQPEIAEMILGDGITPTIDTPIKLKTFITYGADFDQIDMDDPEVKKKSAGN